MTAPVLVVGAGIGGLSAAIGLAARGARVRVIEAGPRPGGKAAVEILDGLEVDTGPSVLTLPHVFGEIFESAGTTLDEQVELLEPDPAFRYYYPDGTTVDVRPSVEGTLQSVDAALGSEARDELATFLSYAEQIWEAGGPPFVFGPAPTVGTLLRLGVTQFRSITRIDSLRRMWSAIERRVRSEPLRWLLARYATYNGSDPRFAPATINCIAWVELGLGGFGVAGGIHELVRAMVRVAEGLGVEFEYGRPVEGFVMEGGRAVGVETATGRVDGCAIVANADAAHVRQDLLPKPYADRIPVATPSMSGFNAILRADKRDAPRPAHAVLFPRDYLEEFVDIFDRDRPPADPTIYLCAQASCHRRQTWPDAEPVFMMANAPAEPASGGRPDGVYERLERTMLERLVAADLLNPEDRVLWRRTPRELADRFRGSRGALYGAASNSMTAAFQRPPNRLARARGVYLASGSAHPGGGMPLCAQSGRMAASQLAEDLGLPEVVANR